MEYGILRLVDKSKSPLVKGDVFFDANNILTIVDDTLTKIPLAGGDSITEWSSGMAYEVDDIINHEEVIYRAIVAGTSTSEPKNNLDLIAITSIIGSTESFSPTMVMRKGNLVHDAADNKLYVQTGLAGNIVGSSPADVYQAVADGILIPVNDPDSIKFLTGQSVDHVNIIEGQGTQQTLPFKSNPGSNEFLFTLSSGALGDVAVHIEVQPKHPVSFGAMTGVITLPVDGSLVYGGGRTGPGVQDYYFSGQKLDDNHLKITSLETNFTPAVVGNLQITVNENGRAHTAASQSYVDERKFIDASDTPADYTGNAGKAFIVNTTEDAIEFGDVQTQEHGGIAFDITTDYKAGDIVVHGNDAYFADQVISAGSFDVQYWNKIASDSGAYKGTFIPTAAAEYPTTPTDGDYYMIDGITGDYTFAAGDLATDIVKVGDKIHYESGVWVLEPLVGTSQFKQLSDTPTDYTGKAGNIVVVNAAANGLDFKVQSTGSPMVNPTFIGLFNSLPLLVADSVAIAAPEGAYGVVQDTSATPPLYKPYLKVGGGWIPYDRAAEAGGTQEGEIITFPSLTPPLRDINDPISGSRYALCDGSTIADMATRYPELYHYLGTTTLPDLRYQFIRGGTTAHPVNFVKNQWLTAKPRTDFGGTTGIVGNHTHSYTYESAGQTGGGANGTGGGHYFGGVTRRSSPDGSHSHNFRVTTGGDHETVPDHVYMGFMIRVTNV